jgi:hypothetical protein
MPVKIEHGTTSSRDGIITPQDLKKIIEDFNKYVSITTISPHETVVRSLSVWFEINEVLLLLGLTPQQIGALKLSTTGMRIHFTVHPAQKNCRENAEEPTTPGMEYKNRLSVAVLPTKKADVDIDDKFVLIPGFKSYPGHPLDAPCCGNMRP